MGEKEHGHALEQVLIRHPQVGAGYRGTSCEVGASS